MCFNSLNGKCQKKLILSGVFLMFALNVVAADENRKPDKIMQYKKVGSIVLKAHVFYPDDHKKTDKRPVAALFFGGGWKSGHPRQFYQQARFLNKHGMVAVSFEYRVKRKHKTTPFECVKDGKSAIRWIRKNADTLGIDPNRVVSSGGSAGGHVAACTGVIKDHEEDGEDLKISSIPNVMVLFNPVIDTTRKGYGAEKVKGRETEISPCHHVRKGIVPTILFHGTKDTTVPFENVKRFTSLMKDNGNECVLSSFDGAGHGFFNGSWFRKRNGDEAFDRIMRETIEFLKKQNILK